MKQKAALQWQGAGVSGGIRVCTWRCHCLGLLSGGPSLPATSRRGRAPWGRPCARGRAAAPSAARTARCRRGATRGASGGCGRGRCACLRAGLFRVQRFVRGCAKTQRLRKCPAKRSQRRAGTGHPSQGNRRLCARREHGLSSAGSQPLVHQGKATAICVVLTSWGLQRDKLVPLSKQHWPQLAKTAPSPSTLSPPCKGGSRPDKIPAAQGIKPNQ